MIKEMNGKVVGITAVVLIMTLVLVCGAGASVRKAAPFEAYSLRGEKIDINFEKGFTLLLFISSDCLECLYCFLELKENLQSFQFGDEVRILPVCFDCDWRKLLQITQSVNSEEMFLVSEDLKAKWGVWETPACFLVDPAARVLGKWEGEVPFAEVEKTLITYSKNRKSKIASHRNNSSSCSGGLCY